MVRKPGMKPASKAAPRAKPARAAEGADWSSAGAADGSGKIRDLDELSAISRRLRAEGRKIVLCHGVFDLLHLGHIRYFQAARRMGDVLFVTLTPDQWVNKGPNRPVFGQHLRCESIAALECVDYVAVNKWPNAVETIKALMPHLYVKGSDYRDQARDRTGGIRLEEEAVVSVGGKLAFTDEITFSSSSLINKHMPTYSKEMGGFLSAFKDRYRPDDVIGYLERAKAMKVLVVGESIIDEYQYCQTMGKSGKEPILAARYLNGEKFAGGVLAVANHLATTVGSVGLVSVLGRQDTQEEFIRERLDPAVMPHFLYKEDAPTIVKRRFVESYPFQKLFEIYLMNAEEPDRREGLALCRELETLLPEFDVVVVTDYGHGMLTSDAMELLCSKSRFLAVNTQMNAGNRGFNIISKYRRADYVCISENEMRLEARSTSRDIRDIVSEVSGRMGCPNVLVTRGEKGTLGYNASEGFAVVPALTGHTVDRVGAGDAVLAITSLCVAQGAPMEVTGLVGNVVGAQAVATVGNRRAIDRIQLVKGIEHLMK